MVDLPSREPTSEYPAGSLSPRNGLLVATAWLPFFLLWTVMNVIVFSTSISHAIIGATSAIGSAALLGFGAWWVSGRVEWPERFRLSFYGKQLLFGSAYSASWIVVGALVSLLLWQRHFTATIRESGWRFVMGLWLYGLVAGVSYVIRFRKRLAEQRELALRTETMLAEARLGQLRSQLNPHFLFNALHTVSYLIGHDAARARDAVERLGDMLRYALDEGGEFVTLGREWAFAQDYLAIESLRLEERLDVEADVDERLFDEAVPIFSLQTLVENAVRHAAARRSVPTRILIRVFERENMLVLNVRDDGPGADPSSMGSSGGLGLPNLQARLQSHFGSVARLEIETRPEEGFTASVSFPRKGTQHSVSVPAPVAVTKVVYA